MSTTLTGGMFTSAIAAATAAVNGEKDAAYIDSVIADLGANPKRVLRREGTTVATATLGSSPTRSGTTLVVPGATVNAAAAGDIASGAWTHRVENAADDTVYVETLVGGIASTADLRLSATAVSGAPLTFSSFTLSGPGLDTVSSSVAYRTVFENAMNPAGSAEGRVLHGPDAGWGLWSPRIDNWPPTRFFGQSTCRLMPWLHVWESAGSTAWGAAHTKVPRHERVVTRQRGLRLWVMYSDTNQWQLVGGPSPWSTSGTKYDGTSNAGFPWASSELLTMDDGSTGIAFANPSGVTGPSTVRMLHSWAPWMYLVPTSLYGSLVAVAASFEARLEPIAARNGTAADVTDSRILAWCGVDPYPTNTNDRAGMTDAVMSGRPKFLTGEWQLFPCWAKAGGTDPAWLAARPIPGI